MTETRTPRFNLPQWSAGSDSPSRTDFNGAFSDIETRGAYDNGDNVSSLPVSGLVAGRYSMLTVSGDGYSLYRYSGSAWQFVGGTLVPRFQRFKALESQLLTDAAFAVEHPSQANANILASYGGDFTAGGVLKSWNANDSGKGALVVGWDGALSLTTTGRSYIRTRGDGELGLVLHAHGAGAGNMLVVREPGNSDIFTVDAIGRLTQRAFAAFGGASLPSTHMVAVAPTSAADSIVNGLLLYGQTAAPTKDMLRVQRDAADTASILTAGRDTVTIGRLPWTASMASGGVMISGNSIIARASGQGANTTYLAIRRSDPTSAVTEANPALDTALMTMGPNGISAGLPMGVTQRYKQDAATMALYRVGNFTASFLDLARLVPDGGGGETAQLASSWASDGRLNTGAWWRSTGTTRDARQPVVHRSRKQFAAVGSALTEGQGVDTGQTFTYTWPQMTTRSGSATDLEIEFVMDYLLKTDASTGSNTFSVETLISINGGSYAVMDVATETTTPTMTDNPRLGGSMFVGNFCQASIPFGANFTLRTRVILQGELPDIRIRMMEVRATEMILENYMAA